MGYWSKRAKELLEAQQLLFPGMKPRPGEAARVVRQPKPKPVKPRKKKAAPISRTGAPKGVPGMNVRKVHRIKKWPADTTIYTSPEMWSVWKGYLVSASGPSSVYDADRGMAPPYYFDPETSSRIYTLRFAIDTHTKKRVRSPYRHIAGLSYSTHERNKKPWQTTWGWRGRHAGESLTGTFEKDIEEVQLKLTPAKMWPSESRVVVKLLKKKGYIDMSGTRFTIKEMKTLLGMREVEDAYNVESYELNHLVGELITTASRGAANFTSDDQRYWEKIKGVYALTAKGKLSKIVPRPEPRKAATKKPGKKAIKTADSRNEEDKTMVAKEVRRLEKGGFTDISTLPYKPGDIAQTIGPWTGRPEIDLSLGRMIRRQDNLGERYENIYNALLTAVWGGDDWRQSAGKEKEGLKKLAKGVFMVNKGHDKFLLVWPPTNRAGVEEMPERIRPKTYKVTEN